jgi:AraC-like DNA-binding protein
MGVGETCEPWFTRRGGKGPARNRRERTIRLQRLRAADVELAEHTPRAVEAPLNKPLGVEEPSHDAHPDRSSSVHAVEEPSLEAANDDAQLEALPPVGEVPDTLLERLAVARDRLRLAAFHGVRVRVYEVALDLDMSEFHFARQFRAAYGCSPHVYYDEIRAAHARDMLRQGVAQGHAARRIGLRRPAELRALLAKRQSLPSLAEIESWHRRASAF